MANEHGKSVIKRVYVPTHVKVGPNGERVIVPGYYKCKNSNHA